MEITTDIKRRDLVWLYAYNFSRSFMTYVFFGFFFFGEFAEWYSENTDKCNTDILVGVVISFGIALAITLICCSILIAISIYAHSKTQGVLGRHEYSLSSEGLFQKTDIDESTVRWKGVSKVTKSEKYLLIWINKYMCQIFPLRSFKTKEDFDAFALEAYNYWRDTQSK